MSDLTVVLTTSKFSQFPGIFPDNIQILNVPICMSSFNLLFFGSTVGFTEQFAEICKSMAKKVEIDSKTKSLWIYDTTKEEGLVCYQEFANTCYTQDFFKRWETTQFLLFEFQVFGIKSTLFVLRGLWEKDHWSFLEIARTAKFRLDNVKN